MINICKIHFSFLYSIKINIITYVLVFLTVILNIYFSNITSGYTEMIFNQESYLDTFLFDAFSIMKVIFILYILMNVLYGYILSNYDIFFLLRVSRKRSIVGKIIVTLFINLFFGTVIYLCFGIIWTLTPYDICVNTLLISYLRVVLFISYYTLLDVLLVILFRHVFILIIPFIGYLISSFSLDYGVAVYNQNHFSKSANFLFPDLINNNDSFNYIYGDIFIISMIVIFIYGIVKKYQEKDIKL